MQQNGDRQELLRVLGLSTAILLVAGNIIGSGVFKKIVPMAQQLHSGVLILLAWFAAGIITMFGAFCFASLAQTTDKAGGQFQYFKHSFGDFTGFLYGWSFFAVISTASIASIIYVFAESVVTIFHLPHICSTLQDWHILGIYPFQNASVKLIAIITLMLLTLFNIRGVRGGGILSNIVTGAKILGIVLLIALGLSYGHEQVYVSHEYHTQTAVPHDSFIVASAFFTAMLGAFWAYDGWVNITNMAGEFKNPTKNIPIAIISGTLITMILYIGVNYAYLCVYTPNELAALATHEGTIAAVEVARYTVGNAGAIGISFLILVSTFGATQASTMSAARVYYQMAHEGCFFRSFAAIHPRFKTPHISLIGQMCWASLLILSGTFDELTDMLVFAAFLFYALGAIAVMRVKSSKQPIVAFGYPIIPILFFISCIVIVINAIYARPFESLTGLCLIACGVPFYLSFRRNQTLGI